MISRMKHGRRGHLDAATCGDPARVAQHLFVGTTLISRDVNLLRALGITHVLNAGGTSNWAGSRLGLELMQRDIADEPAGWPLAPHLQEAFQFIERARTSGGACLVCSDRGISRCSAVAAYYLMRSENMSFSDAMGEIIDVRSCCCPNSGFVTELNALSNQFEQKVSAPGSQHAERSSAPARLPLLSEAARRARDSRSLRGDASTRWRVAIDSEQGHVVHVGIESDGFKSGSGTGATPRNGDTLSALTASPRRANLEAQRGRKEARDIERLLAEQWEKEQRQQQEQAEAMQRIEDSRTASADCRVSLGGFYLPLVSPRQRGDGGARGLAGGCTTGSHRGCLCQICFMNDATARARSARIKKQMDIHPDLAELSSFSG